MRIPWRAGLAIAVGVLSLATAGAVGGMAPATAATPASAWSAVQKSAVQKHASPGATRYRVAGVLNGVVAMSPDDAWAVGGAGHYDSDYGFISKILILHWDGRKWSPVTVPHVSYGELLAISAVSRGNVWAVGYVSNAFDQDVHYLVLHWNGKTWLRSPDVARFLEAVAVAATPREVWVAAATKGTPNAFLHLTGGHWYVVPENEPPGLINDGPAGVAVVSRSSAWAANNYLNDGTVYSLLFHWNGSSWQQVPDPMPDMTVYGIHSGPGGVVWAVGVYGLPPGGAESMRWDGHGWQTEPVPGVPFGAQILQAVAFIPGGTAWAVGSGSSGSLIEHWTSNGWIQVASPSSTAPVTMTAVSAASASDAWAVGWFDGSGESLYTLILHWNGKTWS